MGQDPGGSWTVVAVLDVNLLVAGLWGEAGLLRRARGAGGSWLSGGLEKRLLLNQHRISQYFNNQSYCSTSVVSEGLINERLRQAGGKGEGSVQII